jgi:hypothetical protein
MNIKTIYRDYTVVYFFNHSKMGFSNSVTVNAISLEDASKKAIEAVSGCYGSGMLKRFSFKEPTIK